MDANARPAGRVITGLIAMHESTLLDEAALAAAMQCSKRTLRRMVGRGELPPSIRLAGRSCWHAGRVLAWLAARAEAAEREAERSIARLARKRASHLA